MLIKLAQDASTIKVTPKEKGKTLGTPITKTTTVVTTANETGFSPESQPHKLFSQYVTPARKPRTMFDTSSSDESPPPAPKKTPTRLNPALFGSDDDDIDNVIKRTINDINTSSRPLTLVSPVKVNMEVFKNNEQLINEVAKEKNKKGTMSPIKGPQEFIEEARNIYEKGNPIIKDKKVILKSATEATNLVDIYIGKDKLEKTNKKYVIENKRMKYDKQNNQWVIERDNAYIQNDMRERNLDDPVRLVEKLIQQQQTNKGASTHEISTGATLSTAPIPPPPLNSEQEGGEEDDE